MAYVRCKINAYSPQYNMTPAEKNDAIYTLVVLNIETGLG